MSGDARDFSKIETRAFIKFLFLQGKAPKEIDVILTETLACFLTGRAKDLSAPCIQSKDYCCTIYPLTCPSSKHLMGSVRTNLLLVFQSTKVLCKYRKEFHENSYYYSGPGSSVGIATGYELDGPEIEYRWR